ncbi:DUF6153 family protein [Streptomyces sp. NPDC101150]|uniref:DUF6153 family protein n=1 Tax=Streptomyces sp. NPDC101150 TaxID=3366114 RepID=UPI00380A00D6
MTTRRQVRAGGAMAHLLLVVLLALGVFVMHTVGHPDGTAGSGGHAAAHHAASTVAMSPSSDAVSEVGKGQAPLAHSARSGDSADSSSHYGPGPGSGMNMASLCMAVLGTWALAMLLRAALARHTGSPADLLAEAVVMLRPDPPPRGPDLTQLSVLRI